MTTKSVQVKIELGHKASMRKKPTTEGFTHDWTIFIRGPEGSNIQHFVEKCVFHLHESFPKPKRVVKEPPYQISESGYGSFNLPVEIYFKTKEEPRKIRFDYDLFLHMHDSPPVNHVRCEKLTFQNPTEDFRRKLIKAGGVGIPSVGDGGGVTVPAPGSSPSSQPPRTAESKAFTELFGAPLQPEAQSKPSDSSHSKKHKSHSKDKVRDKERSKSKSRSGHHHQTSSSQSAPKDSSPSSQDKSLKAAIKRPSDEFPITDLTAPPPKKKKKDKDRERSKSSSGKPSSSSSSRERHDKHKSSKSSSESKRSGSREKSQESQKDRDHSKEKHRHRESSDPSRSKSHKKSHKEKPHDKSSKHETPKTSTTPPKEAKSPSKSKTEHSQTGHKRPKLMMVPPTVSSQKSLPSDSSDEDAEIDPCEDSDASPDVLSLSQPSVKVSEKAESRSKDFMQSLLAEQSNSDEDSDNEDMDVDVGTPLRAPQLFTPPTASPPPQPKSSPHKQLSPPKLVLPKMSPSKVVLSKMSPPKAVPLKVSPTRHSALDASETLHSTQLSVSSLTASPKRDERHRKHSSSPQKHASLDKSHSSHSSDSSRRHKSHSSPSSSSSPANVTSQRSRPDKNKGRESSSRHGQESRESIKQSPSVTKARDQEREFSKEVETKSSSTPKGSVSKRKEPEVIKEKEQSSWGSSAQSTVTTKRREPEPAREREPTPTFHSTSPTTVLSKSNKISPPLEPPDLLKSTQHSDLYGFPSAQRSGREKENQGDHHMTNGSTVHSKPDGDITDDTPHLPGRAPNGETFELLLGLQQKLNTMTDDSVLAEVVRILDDSGEVFSMTDSSLDFDLCYLKTDTVHRLKHCFKLA